MANNKIEELNIKNLISEEKYTIPLYQRNYAWGRNEIHQLLKDILDTKQEYYLGTLVVALNEIKNEFIIIDGQQRFTTLNIINLVLKNKGIDAIDKSNLNFESREKSKETLDKLLLSKESFEKIKNDATKDVSIKNILSAVQDIEDFFIEHCSEDGELDRFADVFYNNILLFRTLLPKNTDLNHYFEIMNNRGEQLEKHEILKAKFISNLGENSDKEGRVLYSMIWDACSQVNTHIQKHFSKGKDNNIRAALFGKEYTDIPNMQNVQDVIEILKKRKTENDHQNGNEDDSSSNSIRSIINTHKLPDKFKQENKEDYIDKYSSIIDFPNFLLQVLNLTMPNIRLDDKFLLVDFGYPDRLPDSWGFLLKLLKLKVLFDKYVIKREGDVKRWNWSLKYVINNENEYKSTFSSSTYRDKIKMIESMFQVTTSTNNHKNWLFEVFKYLDSQYPYDINEIDFLWTLERIAKNIYKPNFSNGLKTPRFVFNYLDYILWVEYYNKIRGEEDINNVIGNQKYLQVIQNNKDKFHTFKFVQRSSIEHLFPQARYEEISALSNDEKKKILNSFGNLCLISRSSNSAYNKDTPSQKKEDSKGKNESLKQAVMFGSFVNKEWNTNEIMHHDGEMIELLNSFKDTSINLVNSKNLYEILIERFNDIKIHIHNDNICFIDFEIKDNVLFSTEKYEGTFAIDFEYRDDKWCFSVLHRDKKEMLDKLKLFEQADWKFDDIQNNRIRKINNQFYINDDEKSIIENIDIISEKIKSIIEEVKVILINTSGNEN